MADLNRQVLINLHSVTGTTEQFAAKAVKGEFGIVNLNETDAKIYTLTDDGKVAIFITDKAVESKIAVVNDALTAHTQAYETKVGELELADSNNASAITAAVKRIEELENSIGDTDGALGSRVSKLEDDFAEFDRVTSESLSDLDAAIKAETSARTEALDTVNGKIDTIEGNLSGEVTARENADKALLGVSGDATTAETIWGAKNAAAAAQTTADNAATAAATADGKAVAAQSAADTAKSAADAAQTTATEALGKINAFMDAENVGDAVVDTLKEIQDYITTDGAAADKMTKDIAAAQSAADAAQDAADAADAKAVAAQSAAETAQGAAEAADAKAVAAQTTADSAVEAAAAAQLDATSALGKISAASGTTVSTGSDKVKVTLVESEGKVTSVTVDETDIASASDLDTLNSAAVKSVEFVGDKDAKVTGEVVNNVLKLNFDNLYIDCGTF